MWTVYQGKLKTDKFESSDPKNDQQNFKSLIKDLHEKLIDIQNGTAEKTWFEIDKFGQLNINSDDSQITITPNGGIVVTIPAA